MRAVTRQMLACASDLKMFPSFVKPFAQRARDMQSDRETERLLATGLLSSLLTLLLTVMIFRCVLVFLLRIIRAELPRNETQADQLESGNTSRYAENMHDVSHVLFKVRSAPVF